MVAYGATKHREIAGVSEMKTLDLRAWYVGARINSRALERGQAIESTVQTLRAGERGYAILFRYGAVILIDLQPLEEIAFLETLKPFIESPFEAPEYDLCSIAKLGFPSSRHVPNAPFWHLGKGETPYTREGIPRTGEHSCRTHWSRFRLTLT